MPYRTPEIDFLREQVQHLQRQVAALAAQVHALQYPVHTQPSTQPGAGDAWPQQPIWVSPPSGTAVPPTITNYPIPGAVQFPQFNEAEWGPPGGPKFKVHLDPGMPDNTMIVKTKKPPTVLTSSIITS